MGRYVDLDVAIERTLQDPVGATLAESNNLIGFLECLSIEDVMPVVHAHWTIIYESTAGVTDAKCSNCGFESLAYENDVHTDERCNYCPCCGAKMDEVVETDE